jgi:hypothetical protein
LCILKAQREREIRLKEREIRRKEREIEVNVLMI